MAGRPATASDRTNVPRYRFNDFILSPRRRMLLRDGREQPLIPRYFDLLVFLIERRHEAVHRRDIFDRVWSDVVVSDSALSQAIRTIRRTLGDDSREPRFIRTVSRHGYRFVFADVVEEDDDGEWQIASPGVANAAAAGAPAEDPFEPLLERLTRVATTRGEEEDQREAAELLHALGTVGGACGGSAPGRATRSRERCCATRAGTRRRRPGADPRSAWRRSATAARWSCSGSGAPRASPPRAGRGRRSAAAWPVSPAARSAALMLVVAPGSAAPLARGPGAGADRRLLRRDRRRRRRRRTLGGRSHRPIAADARARARRRAGRRPRRLLVQWLGRWSLPRWSAGRATSAAASRAW